ncbi:MAG: twin-arginine translocase subunit TatC [Phycisphaerales bacterium]|nr:twin-arginine translocase subunit TatC [Phycisphaerales bacterium]
MSFGDHLEELRRRVIWALLGLVLSTIFCFRFGTEIIGILTAPYVAAMEELGFNPRMVQLNPTEAFMEYFKISLKFGLVIAIPWVLYQMWKFIAEGLYPSEKKLFKMFAPTSIILFIIGSSFMVFVVLSGLMNFLIGISMWFPLPDENNPLLSWLREPPAIESSSTQPAEPPIRVPVTSIDPKEPADGQIWFNKHRQRINIHHEGEVYYLRLEKSSGQQFVQPFFSIAEYLGFVVNLGLAFGLGFQIPIVVVFLVALRIITAAQMSAARKYVILAVAVLAAVITPSPDVGTMLLLAVPMMLLFEVGLLIGRIIEKRQAEKDAEEPAA